MENQSLLAAMNPALAHIQLISLQLDELYQAMKSERRAIAEWEEDQAFSILGILELSSTDIQGYAAQVLSDSASPSPETSVAHLRRLNVFSVDYFATWYFANLDTYPQVKHYVEQLDHLRLLLIEHWETLMGAIAA